MGGWVHVMCLCGVHVSLCKKFVSGCVFVQVSKCRWVACLCGTFACISGHVSPCAMHRQYVHASVCVLVPMCLCVGVCIQGGWYVCFLVCASMCLLMCWWWFGPRLAPGLCGGYVPGYPDREEFGQRMRMGECRERAAGGTGLKWGPDWALPAAQLLPSCPFPGPEGAWFCCPPPLWALRRRPCGMCLVAEGQAGPSSTSRLGSRERYLCAASMVGSPNACSPTPSFMLCFLPG